MAYEFGWSPDSKHLVFVGATLGRSNWWVAQLYTEDIAGGQAKSILDPTKVSGPAARIRLLPALVADGARLHLSAALMSDQGQNWWRCVSDSVNRVNRRNVTWPSRVGGVHWVGQSRVMASPNTLVEAAILRRSI